jgi:hypothetical protein
MSVGTANVANLYAEIVSGLVPSYENRVLLPNPSLISYIYNLEGSVGNQIKIPVTNAYGVANVSIGDNDSIVTAAGTNSDFGPSNVILDVSKRGTASVVSTESLEDAGISTVAGATIERIAGSLATSTDVAGFRVMLSGAETAMTNLTDIDVAMDGLAADAAVGACEAAVVFSADAMAMASKRGVEVKQWENIDNDNIQFVGTVRNGFARPKPGFIRAIASLGGIGGATSQASLDQFSTSVANLRNLNATTDSMGFFNAVITPAQELALAKQLNGVGGISSGSIVSLSQELANDALLNNLLTYALGLRFVRSNNLPTGMASA